MDGCKTNRSNLTYGTGLDFGEVHDGALITEHTFCLCLCERVKCIWSCNESEALIYVKTKGP